MTLKTWWKTTASALAFTVACTSVAADPDPPQRVRYANGLVNGFRIGAELRPLRTLEQMRLCAQRHARAMRDSGELVHSQCPYNENVGVGPTLASIMIAFKRSPEHLANLVCDCNRMGIGLARDDVNIWLVQLFRANAMAGP